MGYSVHEAMSDAGGIIGASKVGCSCHGTKSSATVVKVYTDSAQIIAGKTYIFTLSVANPTEKGAGCDMSVDDGGVLDTIGTTSGLQLYDKELTHYTPRVFTGDSAVWMFKYTAPKTAGTAHIYIAGNAVNLDGKADAADHWNTIIDTIHVVGLADVEPSNTIASSIRIFPNPSQGRFMISTSDNVGSAEIKVSDPAGQIVHSESRTLGTATPLDLSVLSNGTYFLSIQTDDRQSFTRSIVIAK